MDSSDLYKIVPESEDSDPGYVQLVNEPVPVQRPQGSPPRESKIPTPSGSKLKISLSQDQLKVTSKSTGGTSSKLLPPKDKYSRKVSVQSPVKVSKGLPSPRASLRGQSNSSDSSSKIICKLCGNPFVDPRVLSCLHSFCLGCLTKMMDMDTDVPLTEKSSTSGTNSSSHSGDVPPPPIPPPLSSIRANTRRASQKSFSSVTTSASKTRSFLPPTVRNPICPLCGFITPLPIGGMSRLPQNTILQRLVDNQISLKGARRETCDNCELELTAIVSCNECSTNLCQSCSESHRKQKITSHHKLIKIERKKSSDSDTKKASKKCSIHPNSDLKLFCTNCNQVACSECTIILHSGHKCESISKTIKVYSKLLNDSISRVRPTSDYANLTISKLIAINKKIDKKCEAVREEVEAHLYEYQKALDHHRNTLFHQVQKAKELKITSIESQKSDLEKRSSEAKTAIEFAEIILDNGSDLEIMSFIGTILKRFEHCEKSKVPLDANVNDSLRFLPEIRAPSTSAQNSIPLFGIITTQTAEPNLCTIEGKGLANLKVNKRVELTLIARDRDNKQLCHGGLKLQVELKYGDFAGRLLDHQVTDKRDGTYLITFTPDATGSIRLSVCIAGKAIRDNPLTLLAKNLKPHTGIYHCCSFCSSNGGGGSKTTACECGGTMEGFDGCGHGHPGHPGRRHWSCCGNILENSECLTANEFEF